MSVPEGPVSGGPVSEDSASSDPGPDSSGLEPTASPAAASSLDPLSEWTRRVGGIEVRFGEGRLAELGEAAREFTRTRVLLVTDPGLVAAGHPARAEEALTRAGLDVTTFSAVNANPTEEDVAAGTEVARGRSIELIVALGGGSAMDCAKGINFLLTNGGRMEDYWGRGKATRPMLPSIGVPTTAGTGSEAQSYALITHAETHRKMACGDEKARFRAVILDPSLLPTAPRAIAAAAGMDALSHALESLVTTARTERSGELSRRAWELLAPVTDRLDPGDSTGRLLADRSDRGPAALGAFLGGAAIEQSMLGAAHAAANPLTARFGVPHGEAIGLTLAPVIRANREVAEVLYRTLDPGGAEALATHVETTRDRLEMPQSLSVLGISKHDLPELAAAATLEWTGTFNPRPLEAQDFEEIYEQVF